MAPTHAQWTRAGDIVSSVKDWTITAVFALFAAFSGAILGVVSFLFLLQMIGDLL